MLRSVLLLGGSFRVICHKCGNSEKHKNETAAKLNGGWWYDSRHGWLCKKCNQEYGAQLPLPFNARNLTNDDQLELSRYFDRKEYE